jgi:tRNA1Val (adenine37-N6)-methyltransferase
MKGEEKYDLIVSNPPFFSPSVASALSENEEIVASEKRKTARFYDSLPFEELLQSASELLTDEGNLAVIIPFSE